MFNFIQEFNRIKTADGKFTKTVGGYILALKKLKSQGLTICESEIKDVDDIYEIIDKANNNRKTKFDI